MRLCWRRSRPSWLSGAHYCRFDGARHTCRFSATDKSQPRVLPVVSALLTAGAATTAPEHVPGVLPLPPVLLACTLGMADVARALVEAGCRATLPVTWPARAHPVLCAAAIMPVSAVRERIGAQV